MKRFKKVAMLIGKCLLSAILVFLVLRKADVTEVVSRVRSVGWFFPGAALTCFVAAVFLAARRWQILSGGLLSYAQTLKYSWIGVFYGAILPGAVSGDVAKGASLALKNKDTRVGELPLSIAMDRIIGLYVLLIFFVISCAILALGAGRLDPSLEKARHVRIDCRKRSTVVGSLWGRSIRKSARRPRDRRSPPQQNQGFLQSDP